MSLNLLRMLNDKLHYVCSLGVQQNESELHTVLRAAELKIIMGLSVSVCWLIFVTY